MHGGKSPVGIASPTFKHGRYSKALPGNLRERIEQLADPDFLSTRCEIAIVRNRILELLEQLNRDSATGSQDCSHALTALKVALESDNTALAQEALKRLQQLSLQEMQDRATWKEIHQLIDLVGKLVIAETKRIKTAEEYCSVAELLVLITAMGDSVMRNVSDRQALAAIAHDFAVVTNKAA